VIEVLRHTPPDERVERAVQEYSQSLRLLCGFKYVSSAVILEPNEEAIRYYLMYATNHPRGVEVFKAAENKAARIQDTVRQESRIKKAGGQLEFPTDDGPSRSRLVLELRQRYMANARNKVMNVLVLKTIPEGVPYRDLFCEAMAFPLVNPDDLVDTVRALAPYVRINLAGSRRKKPSPLEDDRVVVLNRKGLQSLYSFSQRSNQSPK